MSIRQPACTFVTLRNAHAPYYHMRPAPLYNIFPLYLISGTIFEKKKILNIRYVFLVSQQLLSELFILRRIERDLITKNFCV